ncbi:hypothetical protein GX888_03400 [Candidatus Dojkabacteria bacterium]|uniref:GTPase ObgE n=1 Tax=Candidatus Dojkabacteria bacterium TaxID=2099670 RepID=A0A847VE47_9BACT|nr:hypothetical protein [Candidatus Dojkabacteria bacterium]
MKDTTEILIQSGDGGEGLVAFSKSKKAIGGDGGRGGDIYLVGDRNVFDLSKIHNIKEFRAENGFNGEKNRRTGKQGEGIEIHVPLITKVFNEDGSEIITISKANHKVRILAGGNGGYGNFSHRDQGWDGRYLRTRGEMGERKRIKLELNLKADIVFLGYPNAGKSSVVNALSNAKYRVAPYEFTTLEPQLAVMDYYTLMDLPGIIEDTHKGKGLGSNFVKHTKYSKLLVHCISLENEDLMKTYQSTREEFKNLSEYLYSLPELVLFTKADIYSLDKLEEVTKKIKEEFPDSIVISVYRKEDLERLKEELKKRLSSTS